jgi:MATE family multidrug resistance protein
MRSDIKEIVRIAAPLYLSMLAITAGALVNTAVLGRYGTVSLAAFAVVNAVYIPASSAITGAVRGVMPFVSSKAEDGEGVPAVLGDGTWLALFTGALGSVAVVAVPLLARGGGVPDEVVAELGIFPYVLAVSLLMTAVGSMASAVLVGLGHGRSVMRAGLLSVAVTAVLSPTLILGPGPLPMLGLNGAGLAMLTATTMSTVVYLRELRRHLETPVRAMLMRRLRIHQLVKLAKVGVPMAGTVLVKFTVLGVLALAAARVGTSSAAAHSIAIALANLTFTAALAVGQAVVRLVASRTAGHTLSDVRAGVWAGLIVATSALATIGALVVLLRDVVIVVFTSDAVVRAEVLALLPLVIVVVLADGVQAVAGFGMTGLKRTMPSLLLFLACYGPLALSSVPVAAGHGLTGLWTALAFANALLVIGQILAFLRESKKAHTAEQRSPFRSPAVD